MVKKYCDICEKELPRGEDQHLFNHSFTWVASSEAVKPIAMTVVITGGVIDGEMRSYDICLACLTSATKSALTAMTKQIEKTGGKAR